jgi:RNA polymerase sigma factor (sigma-70 family)
MNVLKESDLDAAAARAAGGDWEAYWQLVEQLREPVGRKCLSIAGDSARAEDDASDILLEHLPRKLGGYDSRFAFSRWFWRVVENRALDLRRRRNWERADQDDARSDGAERGQGSWNSHADCAAWSDPLDRLLESETLRIAQACAARVLASKKPAEQAAVRLYLEGWTQCDIAAHLGIAQSQVSRWWSRFVREARAAAVVELGQDPDPPRRRRRRARPGRPRPGAVVGLRRLAAVRRPAARWPAGGLALAMPVGRACQPSPPDSRTSSA